MSRRSHTRKRRRQQNMMFRSGGKFKLNHRGKSGRTGGMHSKKPKGKS